MKYRTCCAAICLWGCLAAGSFAAPTPQADGNQNYPTDNKAENGPQSPDLPVIDKTIRWLGLFSDDDLTAFSTAVIGAFTVVLGIGTALLVTDGRKHSRHA